MLLEKQCGVYGDSLVQLLSCVWRFATPWTAAHETSLSFTISLTLLKLMSVELVMQSNHLCRLVLLLPSVFPSISVFSKELAFHIRWPKYWNFSFSISPSDEYSGLISFRIYWFDLAVQGALNNLLQHHSLKASILQHSAFFMVKLSHLHMTTGIKIAKRSIQFSSVQFIHSVMSDCLQPREPQHTRPSCLSPTPRVYPNSCPLSRWCHPTKYNIFSYMWNVKKAKLIERG